ncbi:hypothetical protein [Paenirhodobacter sp.]|uniref:hypothetical protein n=1 Tax=Paenirhodobacter sp. TaxID=1965326 RepID=UPI003B3DC05F
MKRSILAEVGVDGARRHDLTRQHIYQWRAEFRRRGEGLMEETAFLPVEVTGEKTVAAAITPSPVEIVLLNGRRLRGYDVIGPDQIFFSGTPDEYATVQTQTGALLRSFAGTV